MELREKNLMTEELSQRVGLYADLPLHLFKKKASEYSKEQREFSITDITPAWTQGIPLPQKHAATSSPSSTLIAKGNPKDPLKTSFSHPSSGGWNNNPTAGQFQGIFRKLMYRCGVKPVDSGNVRGQDATVTLLSCDVCRASLVTDASAVPFDQSYHLLELRNNGGLMIPSKGTVKMVRAAERAIRQHSPGKAPDEVVVAHFVREEIGTEDVFALGSHVQESQFGIDNHLSLLLSLVVSVFMRIRLHHIAKLTSLNWQRGNSRKKLGKIILFQGF
ncbi:unnamed protein product [Gadus morhua 'NCC']